MTRCRIPVKASCVKRNASGEKCASGGIVVISCEMKGGFMEKKSGVFAVIYGLVSRIPAGKVATYGQIALMAGRPRAARMVGYALSRAPEGLPCHRVVNREGTMAPGDFFGGQELQRHMLREEGITFRPDGRIDMEKHLWDAG